MYLELDITDLYLIVRYFKMNKWTAQSIFIIVLGIYFISSLWVNHIEKMEELKTHKVKRGISE